MPSPKSTSFSKVRWRFPLPLVPGKLIRRYKRFLADVELESGAVITAHCPNSGSMLGCMEPQAPVFLSPQDKPGRRTSHTWEMIRIGGMWVGINTMLPNRLGLEAARLKVMDLFAGCDEYRGEVKVSPHSRIDLWARGPAGELFVEVKNVTLAAGGLARFPDAKTIRGARHLEELIKLKSQGAGAAMLYIVQRRDAEAFMPADDIDPEYARIFHHARRAGVAMRVVQAKVTPQAVSLWRELPLAGD
ncbi:MAG: DNA/RNA nuclease SfsA [Pseudomonadota bacterium]